MASEAQKRAAQKYDAANTKQVHLKLNEKTDADILWKLSTVDTVQGYIKQLIRNDMKEDTNMKYTIKPEYLTLWGEDANEETMLTEDDIEMIARGWDKDVEDVIDQLEPYNFDSAVELMDDDLREELHEELAPCSDARFMWEYCKRHQEKFGEAFTI